MRCLVAGVLLLSLVVNVSTVAAHHPAHAVSLRATGSYNPFLRGEGGLNNRVNYTFDWSHLDNGAGDLFLNQVEGEYAIVDWFSVLLRIPVVSLQMNFRPSKTGLGDVAFGLKGRVLQEGEHQLILGSDFSFPTGNRNDGTGAGAVIAAPFLAYQYDFGPVQVYSSMGTGFELDNNPELTLLPEAGIAVPIVRQGIPVSAFVSLRGQVFLGDETFTQGSSKVYAVPGLIIYPLGPDGLSLMLSGTFSVVDTLEVTPGEILSNDSLALTQDVLVGATFQINYSF